MIVHLSSLLKQRDEEGLQRKLSSLLTNFGQSFPKKSHKSAYRSVTSENTIYEQIHLELGFFDWQRKSR